jgi:high-affinity Fe2+/Pb2+ permease
MGAPLWATSAFLSDQNVLGNFLTGRIGYRARPSALEVIAYVAYLVIAAVLLSGRTPRTGGQWQQRAIESGALVLVECLLVTPYARVPRRGGPSMQGGPGRALRGRG